jgi:hypothetical protein
MATKATTHGTANKKPPAKQRLQVADNLVTPAGFKPATF